MFWIESTETWESRELLEIKLIRLDKFNIWA